MWFVLAWTLAKRAQWRTPNLINTFIFALAALMATAIFKCNGQLNIVSYSIESGCQLAKLHNNLLQHFSCCFSCFSSPLTFALFFLASFRVCLKVEVAFLLAEFAELRLVCGRSLALLIEFKYAFSRFREHATRAKSTSCNKLACVTDVRCNDDDDESEKEVARKEIEWKFNDFPAEWVIDSNHCYVRAIFSLLHLLPLSLPFIFTPNIQKISIHHQWERQQQQSKKFHPHTQPHSKSV